jgi:hypothetical protein
MVDVAGYAAAKITCQRVVQVAVRGQGRTQTWLRRTRCASRSKSSARMWCWFRSGPGGVIAAVFVLALVGMLILAAVGLLWGA